MISDFILYNPSSAATSFWFLFGFRDYRSAKSPGRLKKIYPWLLFVWTFFFSWTSTWFNKLVFAIKKLLLSFIHNIHKKIKQIYRPTVSQLRQYILCSVFDCFKISVSFFSKSEAPNKNTIYLSFRTSLEKQLRKKKTYERKENNQMNKHCGLFALICEKGNIFKR